MKKVTFFSIVIAACGLLMYGLLNSCNKEQVIDEPSVRNHEATTLADDLNLNARIESFKTLMTYHKENPGVKASGEMSIDSAIWYIGATINYDYSNAGHPFKRLHRDTAYFEMEVLNSYEATIEKVVQAYDVSVTRLSQSYYSIAAVDKKFIMASVRATGNNPNDNVELQIVTITGTGTSTDNEFDENDSIRWVRDAVTNCPNTAIADGAPNIFEAYLNNHFNYEPNPNSWRWVFIGNGESIILNYEDHELNTVKTNYLDYKIFAASSQYGQITSDTECLEYNQGGSEIHEMQFYYDHLIDLVEEWMYSSELNPDGLRYSPDTYIASPIETAGEQFIISHLPTLVFQKRFKAYFQSNEPPIEN